MKQISGKRILRVLVVIFVVGFVLNIGILVWGSWTTPFEKQSMRVALDRIDALERYNGSNSREFEQLDSNAKDSIEKCRRRAITEYDHRLLTLATMQLGTAEKVAKARSRGTADEQLQRMLAIIGQGYQETDAMLRSHLQ